MCVLFSVVRQHFVIIIGLCSVNKLAFFQVYDGICAHFVSLYPGKGGKNRRRGKNENESEKRELVFKEDGQGVF